MSLPPRMPSEPMPVRITARHAALPDVDGRGEQRIDRGLAEIHRRAVVERDRRLGAVAHDPHVAAARREIDAARLDDLAVHRLVRRPAAGARQMLGENGGEGRRHVLGDQHREAVDHGADLGDQRHQRLRAAGRGADHQRARRRHAERAARDRCGAAAAAGFGDRRALQGRRQRRACHRPRGGPWRRDGGSSGSGRGGRCRRPPPRACSPASECSRTRRATAP